MVLISVDFASVPRSLSEEAILNIHSRVDYRFMSINFCFIFNHQAKGKERCLRYRESSCILGCVCILHVFHICI